MSLKDQLKNYYLGKRVIINEKYKGRIVKIEHDYLIIYWEREKDWLVNKMIFLNEIDKVEEL